MPAIRSSIDSGTFGEPNRPERDEFPRAITARNQLATLMMWHPEDTEAIDAARRNLTEAKLAAHVKEALASAPPMTDAQLQRISRLLLSGMGAASE